MTVPARGLEVEKVEEIKTMLGLNLSMKISTTTSCLQLYGGRSIDLHHLDEEYNAKNQRKPIYCRLINCSDSRKLKCTI